MGEFCMRISSKWLEFPPVYLPKQFLSLYLSSPSQLILIHQIHNLQLVFRKLSPFDLPPIRILSIVSCICRKRLYLVKEDIVNDRDMARLLQTRMLPRMERDLLYHLSRVFLAFTKHSSWLSLIISSMFGVICMSRILTGPSD